MKVLLDPGEEKKKPLQSFCCFFLWKNFWRPYEWDLCTTKKKQKKQKMANIQKQTAAHLRVATTEGFEIFVVVAVCMYDTCMRLTRATPTIRSISSSLLPPSCSSSPCGVMGGWVPPQRYTQPPIVSPQVTVVNWQRLPCEEKKLSQDYFFSSLFPAQNTKRQHKLSLFTLPVKCYWSFMWWCLTVCFFI